MSDAVKKIQEVYARLNPNPPKARLATDVPWNYSAITEEWLTAVLCAKVPGARVESFSFKVHEDGSTNRRSIFPVYNDVGAKAGLPTKIFSKALEGLSNRLMLGNAGTAKGEVDFFNLIRPGLTIEVPRTYYAGFDPETYAYIVLFEDIADRALFCDEHTEIDRACAQDMVTLLADFHAKFYNSPAIGTSTLPYRQWEPFWDQMISGLPGWDKTAIRAFERGRRIVPDRLYARKEEFWPATIASVKRHKFLPQTLQHCDVHLKNWYIIDGRMGLADWQIMSVGHWSRDFIYAVSTALTIENRRAWERDLLKLYLERMRKNGVDAGSFDDALLNCRQQLFSALAFWTVVLCPAENMPPMMPEPTALAFLERMLTAIDDLDSLDSF
ncbi:MAG: phosphotransferase [Caulobacterales bacterium]